MIEFVEDPRPSDPRNASCPREAIRPRHASCPRPSDIREAFAAGIRALHIVGRAPSGRAIRFKSSRFPTAPGFPLLSLTQPHSF